MIKEIAAKGKRRWNKMPLLQIFWTLYDKSLPRRGCVWYNISNSADAPHRWGFDESLLPKADLRSWRIVDAEKDLSRDDKHFYILNKLVTEEEWNQKLL